MRGNPSASPGVVTISSDVDFNLATGAIPMGKRHRRTQEMP